jgi:photosystem II stability/assembly factor-like uncharacterized protein
VTTLLIGTKKGLFTLGGSPSAGFSVMSRDFEGEPVQNAAEDPRTGRRFCATSSAFFGPKLFFSDDDGATWSLSQGLTLPASGDEALKTIWTIVPGESEGTVYVGGDPGVLFESHDGGETFEINEALWSEPSRERWGAGAGGMCLNSIVTWPGDPDRLALAISAAGVWLSDDAGKTWRSGNAGLVPRYLPEDARDGAIALCVHRLQRAPSSPERIFMQFHGGVYRSDDAGASWSDIGAGLPSDFGFPLVLDPADPDSAFVIPLVGAEDRVTPEGRVAVYGTRDAGTSWSESAAGLPSEQAFLTVLRHAFAQTGEAEGLELYFGATNGDVFASGDAGKSWSTAATYLPPVSSVAVAAG